MRRASLPSHRQYEHPQPHTPPAAADNRLTPPDDPGHVPRHTSGSPSGARRRRRPPASARAYGHSYYRARRMSTYVQQDQPEGVPPLELTGERTLPDVPEENYW